MIVGLVGQPGAGKTTIADNLRDWSALSEDLELGIKLEVISTSQLLNPSERGQVLGPERVVRDAVQAIIEKRESKVYVIDSMPRTLGQLFWLHQVARDNLQYVGLVFVEPPDGVVLERIVNRGRDHEEHWLARREQYKEESLDIWLYRPDKYISVSNRDSIKNAEEIWAWICGQS